MFQRCVLPPSSIFLMVEVVRKSETSTSTRLHGAISQKDIIFILVAVRTLNILFHRHLRGDAEENHELSSSGHEMCPKLNEVFYKNIVVQMINSTLTNLFVLHNSSREPYHFSRLKLIFNSSSKQMPHFWTFEHSIISLSLLSFSLRFIVPDIRLPGLLLFI
jgi:hypothetical protein